MTHGGPSNGPIVDGVTLPPQGRRFQTRTEVPFPPVSEVGPAPFADYGGSPVWVGSAIFEDSVHPCKLVPTLTPCCSVPYGGGEHAHHGRYDLLPITPQMEWVSTNQGIIPEGRRPVDGGYEASGERLYHAIAVISLPTAEVVVPGKTGLHLGGANIPFGNQEHVIRDEYCILCWKD